MLHTLILPRPGIMVSVYGSTTGDTDERKALREVTSCLRLLRRMVNDDRRRSHPPNTLRVDPQIHFLKDNTTSDPKSRSILTNLRRVLIVSKAGQSVWILPYCSRENSPDHILKQSPSILCI